MTTPNDMRIVGPPRRPTDDELATMPTVKIPWGRRPVRRDAPLMVAAAVNTLVATFISVAVVVILVVLARLSLEQRPSGAEVPVALAGWLLAHGVPLKTSIGEIALAPLSIALLAAWRLIRAGVHTTRGTGTRDTGSVRSSLEIATCIGVVYGLAGLLVAFLINGTAVTVTPWRAALHLLVFGTLSGLLGSVRTTGALRRIAVATPLLVRDGLRTGVVAALLLLGLGAGTTGLAIALRGGEAMQIFRAYPSGVAGQAGVMLVCLAFAPNLAAWAAAYLLGPGFVIGPGTAVRAAGVTIGEMPPLPVLAGLPSRGLDGPLWLFMVLPVLAGLAASLLLVRRRLRPRRSRSGDTVLPVPRWGRMLGSAAVGGVVAGLLSGAAALAAGGHLDGGRPYLVGSVAWQVALFATLAIGLGGLLGVMGAYIRQKVALRSRATF